MLLILNKQDQLCSVTCVSCNISFNIVQGPELLCMKLMSTYNYLKLRIDKAPAGVIKNDLGAELIMSVPLQVGQ